LQTIERLLFGYNRRLEMAQSSHSDSKEAEMIERALKKLLLTAFLFVSFSFSVASAQLAGEQRQIDMQIQKTWMLFLMQRHRRLDDAQPRLLLRLGALLESVAPLPLLGHSVNIAVH
jgi:hypothetical protein